MRVHALASLPHYREHIDAIWRHFPASLKGEARWGAAAFDRDLGEPEDVVMIAGYADIDRVREHRMIYVEHGAGQSYVGVAESRRGYYHGSDHGDRVVAYISPRQEVADSWRKPAFAARAPVCDPYPLETGNTHPCVAITFHWDARLICPEARSAYPHYAYRLGEIVHRLRKEGFAVVGHHHPRDTRLPTVWRNLGVEIVDVDTVRRCADLLIADNTSLIYEMAYLNRNVIALNAPWYRRTVSHGLRFWEALPSFVANDADELLYNVVDGGWQFCVGYAASSRAYEWPLSDGHDGLRAAAWVTSFVASL